jgi:hypothetical protein
MMAAITEVVSKAMAPVLARLDAMERRIATATVAPEAVDAAVAKAMAPVLVRLDALERRITKTAPPRLVTRTCAAEALEGMRIVMGR